MCAAAETVLGQPAEIAGFPGGTDVGNLGFPCVIVGPGSLEQAHATTESIEIDQLERASEIYVQALLNLNGVAPDRPRAGGRELA